jgi:hypothetical protein
MEQAAAQATPSAGLTVLETTPQHRRFLPVQHRVTVRTDRAQVSYRIDYSFPVGGPERVEMVDMDKPRPDVAVPLVAATGPQPQSPMR